MTTVDLLKNCDYPCDSAIDVYLTNDNIWLDDNGTEYLDLKCFGFSALQRETILKHIYKNINDEYVRVPNNNNELVEIFWEKGA